MGARLDARRRTGRRGAPLPVGPRGETRRHLRAAREPRGVQLLRHDRGTDRGGARARREARLRHQLRLVPPRGARHRGPRGGKYGENGRVSFDPRPFIKEIARGKHAARDLTREGARELFAAILSGEVSGAALGAILVALRVKGECTEELAGMMDALAPHVRPMAITGRRALPVVIGTY